MIQSNLSDLQKLNRYELLGKEYYQHFGKNLSYTQYLFLHLRSPKNITIDELTKPSAITKQKEIQENFRENYHAYLNDQDFMKTENNIEVEKLLRYVDIPPHSHNFVECSYILSGSCTHVVSGKEFHQAQGTFSFISSEAEHQLIASPDCVCITVKIRNQTFLDFNIPNLTLFALPLYFQCGDDSFLQEMFLFLYAQQLNEKPYYERILHDLFQSILTYLIQNYRDSLQYFITAKPLEGKMLEIGTYIFENYQTITLHSLASHFHYSDAYLSNLIHEYCGITFSKMLRNFKMEQSKKLLQTTSLDLNEICDSIGYKDSSQFIRDFKRKYGITPGKYRKQFQEK